MNRLGVAAALLVIGCTSVTGPERVRALGVIVHYDDGPALTVPDTVEQGEDFTVDVVTYGSRHCHEMGETEVERAQDAVVVTPYDYELRQQVCDDALVFRHHRATLRAEASGILRVVIRGRELPADRIIEFTRDVVVN